MYYVKKDKKNPTIYFSIYKDFKKIEKFLTFSNFIEYLILNKISFNKVKLIDFSINDLFTHFIDYSSVSLTSEKAKKIFYNKMGGRI